MVNLIPVQTSGKRRKLCIVVANVVIYSFGVLPSIGGLCVLAVVGDTLTKSLGTRYVYCIYKRFRPYG